MALSRDDAAALDALGPVLCRLGHQRIDLSWQAPKDGGAGYYFVDGRDSEGRFFSGHGDTPSEAVANAARDRHTAARTLVHA